MIALLEQELGRPAIIEAKPRPAADVEETWASVDWIGAIVGYRPTTPLKIGTSRFFDWFKTFEGIA